MAHPYISGPGNITQMVLQLRKSFPATITSDTVKKLGLAPNNESYLINSLQFIGLIDSEGKKTAEGIKVFSNHKDEDFTKSFAGLVKKAYAALFELHGDNAWTLDDDDLVTFFRRSDSTSDAIGRRQANTFKIFAALSGHGEVTPKASRSKTKAETKAPKEKSKVKSQANRATEIKSAGNEKPQHNGMPNVGLTVRVEINLPADGTKETYDNIFKSIKENLLNNA